MLEDVFLEEDIWEYKFKRKLKLGYLNNCFEIILEFVEKVIDGKY